MDTPWKQKTKTKVTMSFPRGYVLVILLMLYTVSVLHLYFGSFTNGTPKLHIVFILRVIVPSNNHFLCFSVLRNRSENISRFPAQAAVYVAFARSLTLTLYRIALGAQGSFFYSNLLVCSSAQKQRLELHLKKSTGAEEQCPWEW